MKEEHKSHCCNAEIRKIEKGEMMFGPITGALICTSCNKYCCYASLSTLKAKKLVPQPLQSK